MPKFRTRQQALATFSAPPLALGDLPCILSKDAAPAAHFIGLAALAHAIARKAQVRGEHPTHQLARFRIAGRRERLGPGQALSGVVDGPGTARSRPARRAARPPEELHLEASGRALVDVIRGHGPGRRAGSNRGIPAVRGARMGQYERVRPSRASVRPTSDPPPCSRELWALHGHHLQAILRPIAADRTSQKLRVPNSDAPHIPHSPF